MANAGQPAPASPAWAAVPDACGLLAYLPACLPTYPACLCSAHECCRVGICGSINATPAVIAATAGSAAVTASHIMRPAYWLVPAHLPACLPRLHRVTQADDELLISWRKMESPFLHLPPFDLQLTGWREPFAHTSRLQVCPLVGRWVWCMVLVLRCWCSCQGASHAASMNGQLPESLLAECLCDVSPLCTQAPLR
jgi:hypothetical protein